MISILIQPCLLAIGRRITTGRHDHRLWTQRPAGWQGMRHRGNIPRRHAHATDIDVATHHRRTHISPCHCALPQPASRLPGCRQPFRNRLPLDRRRRYPQGIQLMCHRTCRSFQPPHTEIDHSRRGQRIEQHRHQRSGRKAQLSGIGPEPFPDDKNQPHQHETGRHGQQQLGLVSQQDHEYTELHQKVGVVSRTP